MVGVLLIRMARVIISTPPPPPARARHHHRPRPGRELFALLATI